MNFHKIQSTFSSNIIKFQIFSKHFVIQILDIFWRLPFWTLSEEQNTQNDIQVKLFYFQIIPQEGQISIAEFLNIQNSSANFQPQR